MDRVTQAHVQPLDSVVAAAGACSSQNAAEDEPLLVLRVSAEVVGVVDNHQAEQLPVDADRSATGDVAQPQRGAPAPGTERVEVEVHASWVAHYSPSVMGEYMARRL